jgi:hypothetical protein
VQVIQYAGRAVQLAQQLFGDTIEARFLDRLALAKSNIRAQGDGRRIYEKAAKPAMVDLSWVGAHYAVSSLFEEYGEETEIHCYVVDLDDYQVFDVGKAKLAVGWAEFASQVTLESATLSFGVLHLGDHNLNAGVREYQGEETYQAMVSELTQAFSTAEFPSVFRLMDKHFGHSSYSLRYLFRDEQRKILDRILESTLAEVETAYRQVYDMHHPLMLFLTDLGNPLPRAFHGAAEFILNTDMRGELSSSTINVERVEGLLDDASAWDVELDTEGLSYMLQRNCEELMEAFASDAEDGSRLPGLIVAVELARSLPFEVNLWKAQNIYWSMLHATYPEFEARARKGDEAAKEWVAKFTSLGEHLSIRTA